MLRLAGPRYRPRFRTYSEVGESKSACPRMHTVCPRLGGASLNAMQFLISCLWLDGKLSQAAIAALNSACPYSPRLSILLANGLEVANSIGQFQFCVRSGIALEEARHGPRLSNVEATQCVFVLPVSGEHPRTMSLNMRQNAVQCRGLTEALSSWTSKKSPSISRCGMMQIISTLAC